MAKTVSQKSSRILADKIILLTLIVSALGYFVDVFDLLLFLMARVKSLKDLGVSGPDLLSDGIWLLNLQQAGLLLGGVVWGVLGDKRGRVSVLFGSIILYSLGSFASGFVTNVPMYALLRFITGFGLAGELGVCITLVSELLPQATRGLGTMFVTAIGLLGAVAAALVIDVVGWREAYMIGGLLGFLLLALRVKLRESGLYNKAAEESARIKRGSLLMFFKKPGLLRRYAAVVLIGTPIWVVMALFISFAPEFARDFGSTEEVVVSKGLIYWNAGGALASILISLLSQLLSSRRQAVAISLLIFAGVIAFFLYQQPILATSYYGFIGLMSIGVGYWPMMVQMGAEQFGTNLRATAATSIPNVVRAMAIPATLIFQELTPVLGVTRSGAAVTGLSIVLAFVALFFIKDTFHTDLDYTEK